MHQATCSEPVYVRSQGVVPLYTGFTLLLIEALLVVDLCCWLELAHRGVTLALAKLTKNVPVPLKVHLWLVIKWELPKWLRDYIHTISKDAFLMFVLIFTNSDGCVTVIVLVDTQRSTMHPLLCSHTGGLHNQASLSNTATPASLIQPHDDYTQVKCSNTATSLTCITSFNVVRLLSP